MFLVTTMPSRLKGQGAVASATGFIDGWGYIGSVVIGILVPFILDKTGYWASVFQFWGVISIVIAVLVTGVYIKGLSSQK